MTEIHHRSGRYLAPSATMLPRSAVGGCTPRPRNERLEPMRITNPMSSAILVRTDGAVFGRTSRKRTCHFGAPMTSAATTKPSTRIERTWL